MADMKNMPDTFWRKKLTDEEYRVLREKGTEPAFSGVLFDNHETGMYQCKTCGEKLFASNAKFDSGTGWPSFDNPVNRENIELKDDNSFGMHRTEVVCKNCGSHLGHLFSDGPENLPDGRQATGLRYCINSCALNFKPQSK